MEVCTGRATIEDVDDFLEALTDIGDEYGATVQAFDARYVAGRQHLERAVELAGRARGRGEAIANDHGVEILLYAAGRRQINRALAMGVQEGECPVAVVVVGGDERDAAETVTALLGPGETLAGVDEETVCDFFDVNQHEREATAGTLEDIVCERVALLVVER